MITVQVTYTVEPGFVEENKKNIHQFLNDFKNLDTKLFSYNVYMKADKNTFVHMSSYQDQEMQKKVLDVASFKDFQQKRDESGLKGEPRIEVLEYEGGTNGVR